jgi:hypothetical protein
MKISRRLVTAVALTLSVAACGGGGGGGASSGSVELGGVNVSSGLGVNPNGFAFANFGSAAIPAQFGAEDVVQMFGSGPDVCVDGKTPCQLVAEAAAWARMVNQARAAGHCEGFAVTSANRFASAAKPSTVELKNEGDITQGLMRSFATQFLKEAVSDTEQWATKSLKEKIAALEKAFASKQVAYTLGVYSSMGGHAILPYALEYVSADVVKIMVYDSNWPGKDRYVTVDLKADKWTFAYAGEDPANDPNAWSGGPADMDLTSMAARTSATCPFCAGKTGVTKSMLVVRSAALNWSVTTPGGVIRPGSAAPSGTTIRPVRSAAGDSATDFMISVPSDQEVTFSLPSATRVTGVTGAAAIQIDTPGSESSSVTISDTSISTNDPNVVLTLADGNLVASANGENNSISTEGEQIAVELTTSTGQNVEVAVNEDAPAVDVITPGRDGSDVQSGYQVQTQIDSNTIQQTTVDANGKESTKTIEGQLSNTQSDQPLPDSLEAPVVKAGLPELTERVFTGEPATDNAGTAATAATTANSTQAGQGSSDTPPLRPVATIPGG